MARPGRTTTRDVPIPGFVGTRMDPKTRQALALETFKERRAERQRAQVQKLLAGLIPGRGGGYGRSRASTTGPRALVREPPGPPGDHPDAADHDAKAQPAATGQVPGADKISPQFMAKAQKISTDLGMRLDDFLRVMSFETAGMFLASAEKSRRQSSGTGLIQFLIRRPKVLAPPRKRWRR